MSKSPTTAQNPLMLRFYRLMDAFAKSDDERDFYLDKMEGFIVYVDLDKNEKELMDLEQELLVDHPDRYLIIPKMTFYETKKFMEGFVNEKVYDIDTKEKLLDIIQAKEARENFLEFIYDHLTELEKWQQFYQERSRIRIIEWLRQQKIQFVFEEDLEFTKVQLEKLKKHLFDVKVPKDVAASREILQAKAKTYYSNEALNPRPKRGRPPKQVVKVEVEPQVTVDLYSTVPPCVRGFLFLVANTSAVTFSRRFDTEAQLLANLRGSSRVKVDTKLQTLSDRLESLRHLSSKLADIHETEDPLIRAVTQRMDSSSENKMAGLVKGSFAQKKETSSEGKDGEKKTPSTKIVTQIKKKGGK
jgi:hypothetical protein